MQVQGQVLNIASANHPDGNNPTVSIGRQGEQLAAFIHGEAYTAALRANLFHGSTAPAGITIPISSATAATFVLHNPASSGKNLELVELAIGVNNAAMVVAALLLGVVPAAPTAVTPITATIVCGRIGGATPAAALYSVATIVASTAFYLLSGFSATAGLILPAPVKFNGGLIIPPGYSVHLCSTAAQTQAHAVRVSWAEWNV